MRDSRFVGRKAPLAMLEAAVKRVLAGREAVAAIGGEPGVGKTRLAAELAERAARAGMQVHWGRCFDADAALPAWPWVQVVRSVIASDPTDDGARAGRRWEDLSRLVEYATTPAPSGEVPPGESTQMHGANVRVLDGLASGLRRAAGRSPLLIILDDLQEADLASLHLLRFLSLELQAAPLLLLATYRNVDLSPDHPLHLTLGELARHPAFTQITLEGLSQTESAQLLRNVTGRSPDSQTLATIHRRATGNPLFVTELAQLLLHAGTDAVESEVPEDARLTIRSRIRRHSLVCARVLSEAALLGQEFDLECLMHLASARGPQQAQTGESDQQDTVRSAVAEGLRAGFLAQIDDASQRFRFTHPLVCDVFREETEPMCRGVLHARVATVLEKYHGAQAQQHTARIAHHLRCAGAHAPPDSLAHYCALAAREAYEAYDYDRAVELYTVALEALEAQAKEGAELKRAELSAGLGRARMHAGDRGGALGDLLRAYEIYERIGALPQAIGVITSTVPLEYNRLDCRLTLDLVERVQPRVNPDSLEWAWLVTAREASHDLSPNWESDLNRALEIAVSSGDHHLERFVLTTWLTTWVDPEPDAVTGFEQRLERLFTLAREQGCLKTQAIAHSMAGHVAPDEARMREHRDAALRAAEQLGERPFLAVMLESTAAAYYCAGWWADALRLFGRSFRIYPGGRTPRHSWMMIGAAYQCGDIPAGDRLLESWIDDYRREGNADPHDFADLPIAIWTQSHIAGRQDNVSLGMSIHERLAASADTLPPRRIIFNLFEMGVLAAELGDSRRVADIWERLQPLDRRMFDNMPFQLGLALMAMAAGDTKSAAQLFERCVSPPHKPSTVAFAAWVRVDYAEAFAERADARLRARLRDLVLEALAIGRRYGMPPLEARATAVLEKLADHSQAVRDGSRPSGLTTREAEVLRHIAMGSTNQEISRDLAVSENTVAHHATAIFAKIRVTNRVDAATWAVRSGLL